jgi:4-carboxymuconolactone decarboxylase
MVDQKPDRDRLRELLLESSRMVPAPISADWSYYVDRYVANGVWARPILSARDRSVVVVAAVAALRCPTELRTQIRVALHHGVTRDELSELMLQVAGYAGIPIGLEGMRALYEVLDSEPGDAGESQQFHAPSAPSTELSDDELLERGRSMLAMLGPRANAPLRRRDFAPDWIPRLVSIAFGELWSRPGLTLIERERITMAVIIALGRDRELESHIAISLHLGITREEIGEMILHLMVYVGFVMAVDAMNVATNMFNFAEANTS